MAKEIAISKEVTGVNIETEVKMKFMVKYSRNGESFSKTLGRVLTDLTRDVLLPKAMVDELDALIVERARNREENRRRVKAGLPRISRVKGKMSK